MASQYHLCRWCIHQPLQFDILVWCDRTVQCDLTSELYAFAFTQVQFTGNVNKLSSGRLDNNDLERLQVVGVSVMVSDSISEWKWLEVAAPLANIVAQYLARVNCAYLISLFNLPLSGINKWKEMRTYEATAIAKGPFQLFLTHPFIPVQRSQFFVFRPSDSTEQGRSNPGLFQSQLVQSWLMVQLNLCKTIGSSQIKYI